MKMTFIANACCIYESQGKKILCDPWLIDGAFEGSWFHYPPLKTKPEDIADYDYLYISHLHPDHYDRRTLDHFDKTKPVIVYDDNTSRFLIKMLIRDGFRNIIPVQNTGSVLLGPYRLSMFGPFTKHPFHECSVGNIVDSCLVIEADNEVFINTNDNTPSEEAAAMLKDMFPEITLAQLNYNPAGPYPACFYSLTAEERSIEANTILLGNGRKDKDKRTGQLEHMAKVTNILKPKYVQPFAGAYVLGGRKFRYNHFLGTTTQDKAAEYLHKHCPESIPVICNEGKTITDVYEPISSIEMNKYIDSLRMKPYTYTGRAPKYHDNELLEMLNKARANMFRKQEQFNYFENYDIYIKTQAPRLFHMNLHHSRVSEFREIPSSDEKFLMCDLNRVLLEDILEKRSHWNNAEIGCHIDFYRYPTSPKEYRPDLHTMLSFFHV